MRINIKVYPNSKKERVLEEHALFKVYVSVPPEKGKANTRVCELIAKHFKVRSSCVRVVRGQTSRQKILEIAQ